MPISDPVTYLKKSIRLLWQAPAARNLHAVISYYSTWREHLKPGRNSVDDKTPWICFSGIEMLKKIANPEMRVFEYGSGGSTMFWISRVKELVSIEHDLAWYEKMKSHLEKQPFQNVHYILAEPKTDLLFEKKHFEEPNDFISADPGYAGKNFEEYAKTISRYKDSYFDIVIVDGRVRNGCIQQAIPKIKKGGWLIVDNTERKYYTAPFTFDRKSWEKWKFAGPVPYMRGFSETTFFKKLT